MSVRDKDGMMKWQLTTWNFLSVHHFSRIKLIHINAKVPAGEVTLRYLYSLHCIIQGWNFLSFDAHPGTQDFSINFQNQFPISNYTLFVISRILK